MKINKRFLISAVISLSALGFYACSPASPKLKPEGKISYEKVNAENNNVFRRPSVDILFVVDDSGSMQIHQNNVISNMDQFVDEFSKLKLIDYHIGVISTDISKKGQLQGYPYYVESGTKNGLNYLKKNLKLGTNGSGTEMMFDPVAEALSSQAMNGYNSGFYRSDAYLVIIFVTDAEDQSVDYNEKELMSYLLNLKRNKDKILSYGALVPSNVNPTGDCQRDGGTSPFMIENFLNLSTNRGKNKVSLCDPQFGTKLVEFSKEIVNVVNKPVVLSKAPIVSTIQVTFGTQVIPSDFNTGWFYNPKDNSIEFGKDLFLDENQPADAKIDVSFDSAKF